RCLSDWSSDVCSSDLGLVVGRLRDLGQRMEQDREGLQLIFENTSIGVGRYQADGRLEQGNPALLTLLDEDAGMLGSGLRAMAREIGRASCRERGEVGG